MELPSKSTIFLHGVLILLFDLKSPESPPSLLTWLLGQMSGKSPEKGHKGENDGVQARLAWFVQFLSHPRDT